MLRPTFAAVLFLLGCRSEPAADARQTRGYARPLDMVSRVAAAVLIDHGLQIRRDRHGDGTAEIEARDPASGRTVAVRAASLDEGRSFVAVEIDPHDRLFGETLLNEISDRVGEDTAREPPVVRSSLDGRYVATLQTGVNALDDTVERLELDVVERDVRTDGARLEARGAQGTVMEIEIVASADELDAQFTARAGDIRDATRNVALLKSQFELALEARR